MSTPNKPVDPVDAELKRMRQVGELYRKGVVKLRPNTEQDREFIRKAFAQQPALVKAEKKAAKQREKEQQEYEQKQKQTQQHRHTQ
jgi:hypothetical protein